jgi:outer membrane protein assembly factor BamB
MVGKGMLGSSGQDVSVIIADGVVFAGSHGKLFCLDLQTGEIRWENELKGMGYNDISLSIEGVSIQYLQKVVRRQS